MRQRHLLIIGALSVAASLVLGMSGVATGFLGGRGADIGIDRAVQVTQNTEASYPGGGLKADEVIGFSQNYYASIRETGSGIGAFEILIDRATGNVMREPGPDMMWNTKYSMMGVGMTGRGMMVGSVSPPPWHRQTSEWRSGPVYRRCHRVVGHHADLGGVDGLRARIE